MFDTGNSRTPYENHKNNISRYIGKEENRTAEGYRILLVKIIFFDKKEAANLSNEEVINIGLEKLTLQHMMSAIMYECGKKELAGSMDYKRQMMIALLDANHRQPQRFPLYDAFKFIKDTDNKKENALEPFDSNKESVFRDAFTATVLDILFLSQLEKDPSREEKKVILSEMDKKLGDFWSIGFISVNGLTALFSDDISDYGWIKTNAPNLHKAIMDKAHNFVVFNEDTKNFIAEYPAEAKDLMKKTIKNSLDAFLPFPKRTLIAALSHPELFSEVKDELIDEVQSGKYPVVHSPEAIYRHVSYAVEAYNNGGILPSHNAKFKPMISNEDRTPKAILQYQLDIYKAMFDAKSGHRGFLARRASPWPSLQGDTVLHTKGRHKSPAKEALIKATENQHRH